MSFHLGIRFHGMTLWYSLLNTVASEMMFQKMRKLTHQKVYDLEENTASTPDVVQVQGRFDSKIQ